MARWYITIPRISKFYRVTDDRDLSMNGWITESFIVEASDRLEAMMRLGSTVWSEQEWAETWGVPVNREKED